MLGLRGASPWFQLHVSQWLPTFRTYLTLGLGLETTRLPSPRRLDVRLRCMLLLEMALRSAFLMPGGGNFSGGRGGGAQGFGGGYGATTPGRQQPMYGGYGNQVVTPTIPSMTFGPRGCVLKCTQCIASFRQV